MGGLFKRVAVVLLCGWTLVGASQEADVPPPRPPTIWIDPALGTLQPIQLEQVAIDIRSTGFLATTTVDLSFHNPNDRVLEGELVFPLSSGQSITGYALEVDGQLRQGVAVPKQTARVAFEEITRQGIDPGLAELTQGNVFRTRLYPIPARGNKRVVIRFDQPLRDVGSGWRYVMPLAFKQRVARFTVHAEALHSTHAPLVGTHAQALSFKQWRQHYVADLDLRDVQPHAELAFDLPKSGTEALVYRVQDPLEPAWNTFATQLDTGLPADLKSAAPRRIGLFYDASGSAADRDRDRELALLDGWLRSLGPVEVELFAFRDVAEDLGVFKIRGGDAGALLEALRRLPLDGGSSYGAVDGSLASKADTLVLIGDGLSNFGSHEPRISAGQRVIVLHAAQTVDTQRLTRLAAGGVLLNLLELSADEALRQLAAPQWRLLSVSTRSGACEELAPAAPRPVGATLVLYGRCKGEAVLALTFGDGAGHSVRRTVPITAGAALAPDQARFLNRLWATARIADLERDQGPESAEALALATRHGVVTARTSLLVLDRIEDYVRYRIEPYEPELAAQYRALVGAEQKVAIAGPDQSHLDQVLLRWKQFGEWHARRHPWLESVLAPTVGTELARWQAYGQDPRLAPLARLHLKQLVDLDQQAAALTNDWLRDGAEASTRVRWERNAARIMLAVDALRMQRLQAWPESDSLPAPSASSASAQTEGFASEQERAEPVLAAAPPPPAAEPMPSPAAESPADASLDRVTVTGGRISDAELGASADDEPARKSSAGPGGSANQGAGTTARIELAPWNPDTPYLAKLKAASDPYRAYLLERAANASTPAFFLDCADFFREQVKDDQLALRILSNLAEIDFESAPLVRVLAYRLSHWSRFDLAVPLFEEALKLRAEEPQSRRDLALALSRAPQPDWPRAVALLWEVVSRPWDGRFPDIELIALHELNDVLARMPASVRQGLDLAGLGIPAGFVAAIEVDLRVVLSWDADNTDIDLWVIDPSGETAIYSHPQTTTGGQVSRDFTGGYGPEVYTIRRALPGTYIVKAHYFGDRQQKLTGAVTVQLEFLTRFNSGDSARQAVTRRLEGDDDEIEIGRFKVEMP